MRQSGQAWVQCEWYAPSSGWERANCSSSDLRVETMCQMCFQSVWAHAVADTPLALLPNWSIVTLHFLFFDEVDSYSALDEACNQIIQQLINVRGNVIDGQEPQVVWAENFVITAQWGTITLK